MTALGVEKLAPPKSGKRSVKNPLILPIQVLGLLVNLFFSLLRALCQLFTPPEQKDIAGQVVLISGTGRGIGREMALEFARQGCQVACAEIQKDLSYGWRPPPPPQVLADFGRVDILVNNAALIVAGSLLNDFKPYLFENVVKVNFLSHIWMCRAFLPEMVKRNSGHIVCISSMSALTGLPNASLYASCKWAITGFMESIRDELRINRNNQVKTTVVCPYFINTSAEYVNMVDCRFPELSASGVAREVIAGMRENRVIFSIPRNQLFVVTLIKLLPQDVRDRFFDIFHANIKDRSTKEVCHIPNFKIAAGELAAVPAAVGAK
ncbi:short-chain dehydrogenase/reductase family 16C member 6-like [Diaphorina citri]|uniref:Short-chain dehydrogenase/reductase family 16C member 6-like n=1 Tax=Diaphorina citri TaxID=121845 RepID=A0A3Q0IP36_DIACI|nr:short-chain dehydrogenase/reductase family 16C member 6-like [Diaphorina citri]